MQYIVAISTPQRIVPDCFRYSSCPRSRISRRFQKHLLTSLTESAAKKPEWLMPSRADTRRLPMLIGRAARQDYCEMVILRIKLLLVSATYTFPLLSRASPLNQEKLAAVPVPSSEPSTPDPANVVATPAVVTFRIL